MKTLSIIPAYNEEKTIAGVVASIKREQPDMDIVIINDGSTDRTSAVARALQDAAVVDLPVNLGIGGAMQTGYMYALRNGYDIAIQIDADGQHDPKALRQIMEPILNGHVDCCIGSRFLVKTAYRSAWNRRLGIFFFTWMISWMIGKTFTDPTSGFRAVNRSIIELFARYYPEDYPEVEAIVLLERQHFRLKEVSVLMHERKAGHSSITPLKSLYYMVKVSLAVCMTRIRNVG
ncbi:glycosyltransferase family 2 protein [Paenibacillus frigoriresistens]|uniref:glycosyltransferase family 2 protein n=1 Tax=Paenibacillus alginolyticus TaxID=59839 RepID=UPI001562F512|nr:glycosyltransferase family 2 protein [Paenibacillus frigoriresistens]NRF92699.1 glycosyltransferase family 2 protein [Paenibacillus frigoriresistens]